MDSNPDHAAARRPPPDVVSAFVRVQRSMMGWKQNTLAALAGVSLSTVQRVERAEAVSDELLDRVAVALRQRPGAFTTPRVPHSPDVTAQLVADSLSWIDECVPVDVAPLRKEAQLRALAKTEIVIIQSDLGETADADIAELREWLDLLGFVKAEIDGVFSNIREPAPKLRRLYGDVCRFVEQLERDHRAVCLVGTYRGPSNLQPGRIIDAGVVAIRSRAANPAASRIKKLLAPIEIDAEAAMRAFMADEV